MTAESQPELNAPGPTPERILVDRLREISDRCAALPVIDSRSDDEIIGYDEIGLPR